tara:strand:+ start:5288 stop:6178 length:891 start_codon:yes stop_codon:yes gene_type:complete
MAFIINGEEIDEMTLEEEFDAIKEHHERLGEVVCCDRDEEFRSLAVDNVVSRTLLHQESIKRFGKPSEAEIDETIEQLKEQHGGEEQFFANINMNPDQTDEIRAKVATTLSVDKILADHVGEEPEPTDANLRQFYKDHQDEFMTDEEVQSWHIYLEPHGPEEANELYAKLRQVRQELLDGADFETKAKELCREDHHMDLGFYKRGGLMQEVEIITFSMNLGEISPVVATHFGYHIFKLIDRKEPKPIPFDDVKAELTERFATESREAKINALLDELKAKGEIKEIQPDSELETVDA